MTVEKKMNRDLKIPSGIIFFGRRLERLDFTYDLFQVM